MSAALRLRSLASTPRPPASSALSWASRRTAAPYSVSAAKCMPTALHRATKAADLRAHPECGISQEKLPDVKHMHHWEEMHATESEADLHADRESILGVFQPLEPKQQQQLEKK